MRPHPAYQQILGVSSPDAVFQHLTETWAPTNHIWDYFVDWEKALRLATRHEHSLHLLDVLVGKADPEEELRRLIRTFPPVARALPALAAIRGSQVPVLSEFAEGEFDFEVFDFPRGGARTDAEIEKAVEFAREIGLLRWFKEEKIRSVWDYALGVEVGLDTNGRKNRSGKIMEGLVEEILVSIARDNPIEFISQATRAKIKARWGLDVAMDKSQRTLDFAVRSPGGLTLVETNFYGNGGSKLKSTAGEYETMGGRWAAQGIAFVWITDGLGWVSTLRPLRETFDVIDHVLNLRMCADGLLEAVLTGR